jgi:hypothetical protein
MSKPKPSEMFKALEEFEEPFEAADGAVLVDMTEMASVVVASRSDAGLPELLRAFEEVGRLWAEIRIHPQPEAAGSDVLFGGWSETDLGFFRARISLSAVLDDLLHDPAGNIGGYAEDEWPEVKADYLALAALLAKYAEIAAKCLDGVDDKLAHMEAKRKKAAAAFREEVEAMRQGPEVHREWVKKGVMAAQEKPKKKAKRK